jgi:hypothetical protein
VIESVCDNIYHYKVHADRSGSLRYSRGDSTTMKTLKGLRDRGVKVELGIPEEHWDSPSAEISELKKHVTKSLIFDFHIYVYNKFNSIQFNSISISAITWSSYTKKIYQNGFLNKETM